MKTIYAIFKNGIRTEMTADELKKTAANNVHG